MMIRTCGASLALLAFGVTILRGVAIGNPAEVVLSRALWALIVFLFMGLGAGWVAQTVIEEHNRLKTEEEAKAREAEHSAQTAASGQGTEKQSSVRTTEGSAARVMTR